jgi:hypothetical protein
LNILVAVTANIPVAVADQTLQDRVGSSVGELSIEDFFPFLNCFYGLHATSGQVGNRCAPRQSFQNFRRRLRSVAESAAETQEATLAARIGLATHNVADLDPPPPRRNAPTWPPQTPDRDRAGTCYVAELIGADNRQCAPSGGCLPFWCYAATRSHRIDRSGFGAPINHV